jgi:hypothetical protein
MPHRRTPCEMVPSMPAQAEGRSLRREDAIDEALRVATDDMPTSQQSATAAMVQAADRLTHREIEVLQLLAAGHSNPRLRLPSSSASKRWNVISPTCTRRAEARATSQDGFTHQARNTLAEDRRGMRSNWRAAELVDSNRLPRSSTMAGGAEAARHSFATRPEQPGASLSPPGRTRALGD